MRKTPRRRPGATANELLRLQANARKKTAAARVTLKSLDDLPLVLRLEEVMAIYRCGRTRVLRGVRAGTFLPAPFLDKPYRWAREDVERDFARRRGAAQQRAQRVLDVAARENRRRVRA